MCMSVACYLAFVVCGGDVHLLLHHVVDMGGRTALDPLLLLPLQLVSHHLDGLRPLVSVFTPNNDIKLRDAALRPPFCVTMIMGSLGEKRLMFLHI